MIDGARRVRKHSYRAATGTRSLVGKVITSREELETYACKWNILLEHTSANSIFLTWEWISTWLNVVYPDAALFVIVVENINGGLVAVAPFYQTTMSLLGHIRYKCLRIIGDCESGGEYQDIIVSNEFAQEAIELLGAILWDNRRLWDCIWLPNVADWTGASERIAIMAMRCRFLTAHRAHEFSVIRLPGSHAQYIASLNKKFRYNILRYTKILSEKRQVECVRCMAREEVGLWTQELFDLHGSRWRSVGQEGSFVRRPLMAKFYKSFAPLAFERGWLRIYALTVDGAKVAMRYGYAYAGILCGLQSAFDANINGGGHILMNMLLEKSIEEKLSAYDFLAGDTDYKSRWGTQLRAGRSILVGKRAVKTQLLFRSSVWPTGRYIDQGKPANLGRSHD